MSVIDRYAAYFETLTPGSLGNLRELVSRDVKFCDPFNDVSGVSAVMVIFEDMFERVNAPRFRIQDIAESRNRKGCYFLRWTLETGEDAKELSITGMSEVHVNDEGLVSAHIDYWDPARQLYEHVPVLGFLMRTVRRRLEVAP